MKNSKKSEWFILTWAQGELRLTPEKIAAMAKQLEIDTNQKNLTCIVVRYVEHEKLCEKTEHLLHLEYACRKACKGLDADTYCYLGKQLYVVVVLLYREKIDTSISQIQEILERICENPVQIGVGRSYNAVELLNDSYVEAFESLACINENASVYYAEDIYSRQSIVTRKLGNEKHKIIELFRAGHLQQAQEEVRVLVEKIRGDSPVREGQPYPTSIRRTFVELIVEIINISADAGVDVNEVLEVRDPYRRVFDFQTTPEIMEWFYNVMQVLHESIKVQNEKATHNVLMLAKNIINECIAEPDLSLTMVGGALGITPTYLSAFFIKEMGIGFNEYISTIRIERAKEQLLRTNKKVHEIATECGFRSISYFNVVFRKQVGISPGAFRNMKNLNDS